MKKIITLNTEPHEAEVGPYKLYFQPEMYGDEFLDAYGRLQEVQKTLEGGDDSATMSGDQVRSLYGEMKTFLARLMTEESAAEFSRFEVVVDGATVGVHIAREDAEAAAADDFNGATVVDKSIRLPDRVLVKLMEWVVELYGGLEGGGNRPTGSSKGSAPASSKAGAGGKGPSPSRASIRAAGR